MRRGFTILELLAASLLLSMLVTIMTMIFNQSSIAWRTGTAGVVELEDTRAALGAYHDIEDDALPGLGQSGTKVEYRTVSIFRDWSGGSIGQNQSKAASGRLYDRIQQWEWGPAGRTQYNEISDRVRKGESVSISGGSSQGGGTYVVGVKSLGPDKNDPSDDIGMFPEDVQ